MRSARTFAIWMPSAAKPSHLLAQRSIAVHQLLSQPGVRVPELLVDQSEAFRNICAHLRAQLVELAVDATVIGLDQLGQVRAIGVVHLVQQLHQLGDDLVAKLAKKKASLLGRR